MTGKDAYDIVLKLTDTCIKVLRFFIAPCHLCNSLPDFRRSDLDGRVARVAWPDCESKFA